MRTKFSEIVLALMKGKEEEANAASNSKEKDAGATAQVKVNEEGKAA